MKIRRARGMPVHKDRTSGRCPLRFLAGCQPRAPSAVSRTILQSDEDRLLIADKEINAGFLEAGIDFESKMPAPFRDAVLRRPY
ncbi:MAG: hypothetical protein LBL45_07260 [Treponema sp.]|nr:hypothetical protein [Treponema sp.]